ncbi:MAG: RagB/SusD family nutrient uptake outer membrane protein, partial [Bacteroidota bacterium]|nr:RagB/SusD family nutrient uptake outer membrane protein [Bacteroidota bacterium]
WDQQYDNCIKECDKVLADENLSLVKAEDMYNQVFYKGNSTESIFELQFDDNVQVNYATRYQYGYSGMTNGFLSFPSVLVKGQYSPFNFSIGNGATESVNDYRYKDFIVNNPSVGYYRIFKYAGVRRTESASGETSDYTYRSNTSNWIVYRLSDVILMKAEAVLQRDKEAGIAEAISLVNKTYHRSNPDADTLNTGEYSGLSEVESLVLRERQRELMFEGKRWFDLMRLARRQNDPSPLISYVGKTTSSSKALGKMSSMDALYWPIAKTELESNPKLKQNPFYETTSSSSSN